MPITISYNLNEQKLREAVRLANEMLASDDLLRIINSRDEPFDESSPRDLRPSDVAGYVENSTLALTLCEYTATRDSIGGMFLRSTPTRIYANRKAIPIRSDCGLARMLVHECIHALSHDIKDADFSHDDDHPRDEHGNTAPYWIQAMLRPLCSGVESDDEVIEVELLDDPADLISRDIKCR